MVNFGVTIVIVIILWWIIIDTLRRIDEVLDKFDADLEQIKRHLGIENDENNKFGI